MVVFLRAVDAALQMLGEEEQAELVERGPQSGDLSKNVDAVPAIVDHLLQSGDLAGDSGQPAFGIVVDSFLHCVTLLRVWTPGSVSPSDYGGKALIELVGRFGGVRVSEGF